MDAEELSEFDKVRSSLFPVSRQDKRVLYSYFSERARVRYLLLGYGKTDAA
jgi:hypothetical protein